MGTRLEQDLSHLKSRLPGKVIFPSSPLYDNARRAWNLSVDQHPDVIVFVENTVDVIEAVAFARYHNMPVAVLGTGHGVIRSADQAMLINTSRMKELRVDPETRTARVGAGVQWGEVLKQAFPYGLAPLLGSSPDVGVVGYSLGGGMGWLARKYGLSLDSILSVDIVTPDGVFRRASLDENRDLFWALRGGGGGFGVVTGMEIRLHPVSEVYGGNLFYPASIAREVFQRFRSWVANAPDELTTSIVLINIPPLPDVPPFLRGQSFAIVRGCYAGQAAEGEKLLDYWRSWCTPVLDEFGVMPFSKVANISKDPVDPLPFKMTGGWLSELSDEAADALIQYTFPQGESPTLMFSEVRLAGGVIAQADADSNAYSHRQEKFAWLSLGLAGSPEMLGRLQAHTAQMRAAFGSSITNKIYMNFVEGEDAQRRTQEGFHEEHILRLQAIKAEYDPDNRFNFGFGIVPKP